MARDREARPRPVDVRVPSFTKREVADALGRAIADHVAHLGQHVDLTGLDGVTVAMDCDAALAAVDMGLADLPPPDRMDHGEIRCVAKTRQVLHVHRRSPALLAGVTPRRRRPMRTSASFVRAARSRHWR